MKLGTASHNLRFKATTAAVALSTAVVTVWGGAGLFFYLTPVNETASRSDGLLVLAPTDGRLKYAEQLMDQGYAHTLAVSVPPSEYGVDEDVPCDIIRPYPVICFQPDPVSTQGEARGLQQFASAHGWTSINVVTEKSHAPRVGMLIRRCFPGEVKMLPYERDLPFITLAHPTDSWAFRYTYETAAFMKVLLNPGC